MKSKEKKISIELLNELGIYELRELARNIGVVSPTTKKRNQLCKEIIEISKGNLKANINQNKKGRPPKSITKISSIVNDYVLQEILNLQKPLEKNSYNNILQLAQTPIVYSDLEKNSQNEIFGYLNSVNNKFYIINLKNNGIFKSMIFFIPESIIKQYALRDGDKVFAKGRFSEKYDCGIVEEIELINDKKTNDIEEPRLNLDINNFQIPNEECYIFGKRIKKGERTISYFKNDEDAVVEIAKEMIQLSNTEEKIVFLGVELAPEVIYYGKTIPNVEMFATTFYDNLEDSYNSIINAFNYCNTILKDGCSIRLFVFDVLGMLTRLDQYFITEKDRYLDHNISSIQIIKKIVGLGKNINNNLYITTHVVAFENKKNDEFIQKEINKIVKTI